MLSTVQSYNEFILKILHLNSEFLAARAAGLLLSVFSRKNSFTKEVDHNRLCTVLIVIISECECDWNPVKNREKRAQTRRSSDSA